MVGDYYEQLVGHPDASRAAGWDHPLGQAARYEAAVAVVTPGDEVLDVGCGPAGLARYLRRSGIDVGYLGLDALPAMVARARAEVPGLDVRVGDALAGSLPTADVVVGIGTLVSGEALTRDGVRFGRFRRLAAALLAAARRVAVVVALDQDALRERPALASDPALGGVSRAEAAWIAAELGVELHVRQILTTDLALYLVPPGGACPPLPERVTERVLAGPAFAPGDHVGEAWLWYASGEPARAREALARPGLVECATVRWLRAAVG